MYGDIIAMYVRQNAEVGGEQFIASFWSIYNQLMEESPETLRVMAEDWRWMPHRL